MGIFNGTTKGAGEIVLSSGATSAPAVNNTAADGFKEAEAQIKDIIESEGSRLFVEIQDEINDDNVTDIEWDGYGLWITDLAKGCYCSTKVLSDAFVDGLAIRLANIMSVNFNRSHPILEANTDKLRISVWHESRSGRKSVTIRKIPLALRFDHKKLVDSKYAEPAIINLLENCITAHLSGVIGGQPHAGKTELLKYLTSFIPAHEKAGVYEDNQEIHYHHINPGKKCSELLVDGKFSYSDAIKAGLRHNVDWILLSESRGSEVLELVNGLSTGGYCLTTVHLEDVRRLPDRMYNMLGGANANDRFINNVYKYINWSALVVCDRNQRRHIKQVAFYTRINQENKCTVIYDDGEFTGEQIPDEMMKRFREYGIMDPYQ